MSCGKEIVRGAKACQDCGAQNSKPKFPRLLFWILVVIISVSLIASGCGSQGESQPAADASEATTDATKTSEATTAKATEADVAGKVSYENFMSIEMGSKLSDIEAILGPGSEMSSSEAGGIKTVMYQWSDSGLNNIVLTIQNDELTGKAQAGFVKGTEKVTMDMYNQVKEGMSYDEVVSILGEGTLSSQTSIMGMESTIYTWGNVIGGYMTCTFTGDEVSLKAQSNLE